LYKIKRVLEKTSFSGKVDEASLSNGNADSILKIIHHLIFRASESFTQLLQDKFKVHQDLKFMPDRLFYKNICLILCDMFGLRIDLTPEQFFD